MVGLSEHEKCGFKLDSQFKTHLRSSRNFHSSPPDALLRRSGSDGPESRSITTPATGKAEFEPRAEMSQEMEEVFIRGVRSLITRYMEHQMEPALRDTLMMNLGYSISYGKR